VCSSAMQILMSTSSSRLLNNATDSMVCLYRCPTNSFFMEAGNMAIMSLSSYIAFSDHSVLKRHDPNQRCYKRKAPLQVGLIIMIFTP
jgi:hypothetical protein